MPTWLKQALPLTFIALIATLTPKTAEARRPSNAWILENASVSAHRDHRVDVLGSTSLLGGSSAFGGAVWYGFPVLRDGLLPELNDSLDVELGTYLAWYWREHRVYSDGSWTTHDENFLGLIPAGGVRWNFHFTPQWSAFATLKLGFRFGIDTEDFNRLMPGITLGANWHFSDRVGLRMETGSPGLAQVGLTIAL